MRDEKHIVLLLTCGTVFIELRRDCLLTDACDRSFKFTDTTVFEYLTTCSNDMLNDIPLKYRSFVTRIFSRIRKPTFWLSYITHFSAAIIVSILRRNLTYEQYQNKSHKNTYLIKNI